MPHKLTSYFALCLLLCLLCTAALGETRLMVVTDLHYLDPQFYEGSDLLARSAALGDGKMPQRSGEWLAALVADAIAIAPDALILAGDQTFNGEVLSHRAISDALAEIAAAGIAVYAIPGNHDINNDNAKSFLGELQAIHSIPYSRYPKYYGAYGLEQAFSRDAGSYSYAISLSDSLWLMMIDAGIYEPYAEAFGLIGPDTREWLADTLAQAQAAGVQVITVSHQSMLPHSNMVLTGTMIYNWQDISTLLAEMGVRLNMSGHLHVQHIAEKNGLYDISLSALSNYPNQYALVTVADDGSIAYATHPLSPSSLPEGLPAESREHILMASEMKAFNALAGIALSDAEKQQMAAYAANTNMHYYGGTLHTIAAAADDPLYSLWQSLAPDSFWARYLQDMLLDTTDMTTLSLPPFQKEE